MVSFSVFTFLVMASISSLPRPEASRVSSHRLRTSAALPASWLDVLASSVAAPAISSMDLFMSLSVSFRRSMDSPWFLFAPEMVCEMS